MHGVHREIIRNRALAPFSAGPVTTESAIRHFGVRVPPHNRAA